MQIPPLAIAINKNAPLSLQKQLQQAVIQGVSSGKFPAGARLPSSRLLAHQLGISRNTVNLAYAELVAIETIEVRERSGYFVATTTPPKAHKELPQAPTNPTNWDHFLQEKITIWPRPDRPKNWRSYPYPFIYGQGDPGLFDHHHWRQCALEALGRKDFETVTADSYEEDDPELVEFIRTNLLPKRGIFADEGEILITIGAQNALMICAQLLLNSTRKAALENPCYSGHRDVVALTGCKTASIEVDGDGLPPENLPPNCDVVFTTVSHQCPTGVTMPIKRRLALLARAQSDGFLVVEDDYEFENSLRQAPSPALKALDETGQVIHIGSFSKSLFPSLRLGYIVASKPLIQAGRKLRAAQFRHAPGFTQRTAFYFLSLGYYDAQLKKMSRAYNERHQMMSEAILSHGLELATPTITSGSSFWMKTPPGIDTQKLALELRKDGVLIEPGASFFKEPKAHQNTYRIAYSSIDAQKIKAGIGLIARSIHN